MEFWQSSAFMTGLTIVGLLFVASTLAAVLPGLRRLGVPMAIVAGLLGLLASEQLLGVVSLDVEFLKSAVYHGLGLLFITVSLRAPATKRGTGRDLPALSMGFAIPTIMCLQALVALLVLLIVNASWHPAFAMLVPLGFEEGPGQALSMGAAWESSGLRDGAQIGLISAALGYGWSVAVGIPLAIVGRRRGWLARVSEGSDAAVARVERRPTAPGGLDHLTVQIALIALCYALTYGLCSVLAMALASMPDIVPVVWGFHFIFGALIAIGVRALISKFIPDDRNPIDDYLMVRAGGLLVDLVTCAALAAIEIAVLQAYWAPLLLLTTVGGLITFLAALWIGSRCWVDAPFEHTLLWFGMSTGTLPTGLALLRVVDPELRTPAATSAVLGSALSTPLVAPLLLVLIPMTARAYMGDWPAQGWTMLAIFVGYFAALLVAWRLLGGLRLRKPLARLWVVESTD